MVHLAVEWHLGSGAALGYFHFIRDQPVSFVLLPAFWFAVNIVMVWGIGWAFRTLIFVVVCIMVHFTFCFFAVFALVISQMLSVNPS